MTKIEMMQYIVDEFTDIKKNVVGVKKGKHPLEAIIVLQDKIELIITGKLAVDLKYLMNDDLEPHENS